MMQRNFMLNSKNSLFIILICYSCDLVAAAHQYTEQHLQEVRAAHQIRSIVFEVIEQIRQKTETPFYYTDDQQESFVPLEQCGIRISRGLLFCIDKNKVPGYIITRWGGFYFSKNRVSIVDDTPDQLGLWDAACVNICAHKQLELKFLGKTVLGGKCIFSVQRVAGTMLVDPFESVEKKPKVSISSESIIRKLSRTVSAPVISAYSHFSSSSTGTVKKKLRAASQLHPCVLPRSSVYRSLPSMTYFKTEEEISWLDLCHIYHEKYRHEKIDEQELAEEQKAGRRSRKKNENNES
jgi:hypothetical protein